MKTNKKTNKKNITVTLQNKEWVKNINREIRRNNWGRAGIRFQATRYLSPCPPSSLVGGCPLLLFLDRIYHVY